jgi:hypothetical protein
VASLGFANLSGADPFKPDVREADLSGAVLAGATLPDGTKLSEDNWKAEFEEWRRKQEGQAEAERDDEAVGNQDGD